MIVTKAFVVGNKCLALIATLASAGLAQHSALAAYDSAGGYVTLLGHNSGSKGESTFMTNIVKSSYGWSDGRDPHSGTNYYCGSYQLCTPKITDGTFQFQGDSLVIGYRLIALATSTIEVEDLRLEKGGYLMAMSNGKHSLALRGNLTVLGDKENPSWFNLGDSPQHFKVESSLKGNSSAYAYSDLAKVDVAKEFVSFATQYVELDDADEYYGTFEVRTNTCLKLASNLPGAVAVDYGGCLTPVGSVAIGTLSLADGAVLSPENGTITVGNVFSASGTISVKVLGGTSYPRALLSVPTSCGALDTRSFTADGVRLTVAVENGVQTLYAELLEPAEYDETTGYVTQIKGGTASDSLQNVFDEPSAWSDGRTPHSDTNYYGYGKGIYVTTNSTFAGRSLTIERMAFRLRPPCSVTIADLRVKKGNSAISSMFTTGGSAGTIYLAGGMEILSRLTDPWPFAFYGGHNGQTWRSTQKISGGSARAFELRGNTGMNPGAVSNYVEFLGDLSEYFGTIIVGTNFTARLGGSVLPGAIRLDTAYSHVDTIAPDGAEVKVGRLESRIGTSISVAATNVLAVTDALHVTGVLAKNGGGVLASCGMATAGDDAAISVAEGGLRAGSKDAFNGIPLSFAAGTSLTLPLATSDADFAKYGLYDSAGVTAAGTLNVVLDATGVEEPSELSRGVLTVPTSAAGGILEKLKASSPWRGFRVSFGSVTEGDMTIFTATIWKTGFTLIFK